MIVDCHAHLDERQLSVPDLLRKMRDAGIHKAALIPRITETVEPDKSELLLSIQRTMMNSSLLRPVAAVASLTFYDSDGALRGSWRPFTTDGHGYTKAMIPDNRSVAEAISQYPENFMGWIFVNPTSSVSPLDELDEWRIHRGMIGVKVHPYWHQYDLKRLEQVCARADELKLPMLVHLGFGRQGEYQWLIDRFPGLKVIFAHAGIPFYRKMWPLIRRHKNAFVDLSSAHLSEKFVRNVVRRLGAEKCLYGTDSPYGFTEAGSYDYGRIKGWIERLPVAERERDLILGQNFCRIVT